MSQSSMKFVATSPVSVKRNIASSFTPSPLKLKSVSLMLMSLISVTGAAAPLKSAANGNDATVLPPVMLM